MRRSDVQRLAKVLTSPPVETGDDTENLLVALALAFKYYERLANKLGDRLVWSGRPLVIENLERAFREAQYIRSHLVDPKELDLARLSRYGYVQICTEK